MCYLVWHTRTLHILPDTSTTPQRASSQILSSLVIMGYLFLASAFVGIAAAVATLVGYTTGLFYGFSLRVLFTGDLRVLYSGNLFGTTVLIFCLYMGLVARQVDYHQENQAIILCCAYITTIIVISSALILYSTWESHIWI
jgi:hypothetical protein